MYLKAIHIFFFLMVNSLNWAHSCWSIAGLGKSPWLNIELWWRIGPFRASEAPSHVAQANLNSLY